MVSDRLLNIASLADRHGHLTQKGDGAFEPPLAQAGRGLYAQIVDRGTCC